MSENPPLKYPQTINIETILTNMYAMQFVGVPYKFGGNNFLTGIDCSGLVCEILKSQGKLRHSEDFTAQQLYNVFSQGAEGMVMLYADAGCLSFYGKSRDKITHVGYCLDGLRMIEAGGGDSTTTDRGEAEARGACVRVRRIDYRGDLVALVMPL